MFRRLRRSCLRAALLLAVLSLSCRDEQAGPKPRPARASSPAQAGGLRTLDAPPELAFRSGATWAEGSVQFLGARWVPSSPRPGQTLQLGLYFRAVRPPPKGYRFFVHLVDADSGQMLLNADHEPQEGAAPLDAWPVGKVIEDVTALELPQPSGRIRVMLGFWKGDSRLPVDEPAAHDGQHRMLGPVLEGTQAPLPEYRAVRAAQPPKVDGLLDDPVWKQARAVELTGSFDGRPAARKTVARVAHDDQFLYVAFDAEDPDVWGTLKNHDDPIYEQEVVEVFLDANADGKGYNELQVSPHNVTFDASFVFRRSDLTAAKAWESKMESAVQVRGTLDDDSDKDQGWSAEMKIPFAQLTDVPNVPPKPGERWRFNLYRLEHLRRNQAVEGQSFSPLFIGDFHALPRFGWLVLE